MIYVFGASWQTSLFAALFFLSGTSNLWMDYFTGIQLPDKWMKLLSLVFGLIAFLCAKDKRVTGGTIDAVTGKRLKPLHQPDETPK